MIIDDVPTYFTNKHAISMTLRDYFAAKAMQAIVSRGIVNEVPLEIYATNAYRMADEMLKAREQ
jgi:hypothetical protein